MFRLKRINYLSKEHPCQKQVRQRLVRKFYIQLYANRLVEQNSIQQPVFTIIKHIRTLPIIIIPHSRNYVNFLCL